MSPWLKPVTWQEGFHSALFLVLICQKRRQRLKKAMKHSNWKVPLQLPPPIPHFLEFPGHPTCVQIRMARSAECCNQKKATMESTSSWSMVASRRRRGLGHLMEKKNTWKQKWSKTTCHVIASLFRWWNWNGLIWVAKNPLLSGFDP